jgi:parallel beta-helix repeat protein
MMHDFLSQGASQGCPKKLVRPIFFKNREGDIRHAGHLRVELLLTNRPPGIAPVKLGVALAEEPEKNFVTKLAPSPMPVPQAVEAGELVSLRVPEDFATVQAALDTIFPKGGDAPHIVINSGRHRGDISITKRVVLEKASGSSVKPVLEGNIMIDSGGEQAEVKNLEIRGFITLHAGTPIISGCIIADAGADAINAPSVSSGPVASVTVSGSETNPTIEGNIIKQGCSGAGVLFESGALGSMLNNTVSGNAGAGVEARDFGTSPNVENNKLVENLQHGLFIHYGASGTFSNNDIHRNKQCGIMLEADTGAGLVVRSNRVHENEQGGVVGKGLGDSTADRDVGDNEEIGPARPFPPTPW